ncbi:thymidylate kinase [Agaricicola taiwanensis]|uniref:Thymidylate kinase n=2 Tax=Agaricicola taiwanensis TaxID=591372 RepID=A0A8J2YIN2_9RHOB|nr:thymidylate kinase [Agaricicola taiwanensis]
MAGQGGGRFITFEGGEGTGKSTQTKRLAARLKALGHEVVLTREPGGSPRAEALRALLLSGKVKSLGSFAEAVLFAAARSDHLRATIRPALARGAWVICDRFADSTRAYQGALGDLEPDVVKALEETVVEDTVPALTIILDLPAEVGLGRARVRAGDQAADRFEAEGLEFHEKLRRAFLDIASSEPRRCVVIDAQSEPDKVEQRVWQVVAGRFKLEKPAVAQQGR